MSKHQYNNFKFKQVKQIYKTTQYKTSTYLVYIISKQLWFPHHISLANIIQALWWMYGIYKFMLVWMHYTFNTSNELNSCCYSNPLNMGNSYLKILNNKIKYNYFNNFKNNLHNHKHCTFMSFKLKEMRKILHFESTTC